VGDTGAIDIQYLPELAERPSSMAEVSGTWGYSDNTGFTATLTIGQSGDVDYSDTDGCTGTGQMDVLDPTLNGFKVSWNWNCVNLSPPWVGPSSGLVIIDDFYDPGTHYIVFAEALTDGSSSDVWSMYRPAQIAAGSSLLSTKSQAVPRSAGVTREPKSLGKRR
jgi:hypothetical protein